MEVIEIALFAAEKKRDAIVRPGNYQGDRSGRQSQQAVAAQGIAEQHGFILRLVNRGQHFLKPRRHARLPDIVQSFGQKLDVDLVNRLGNGGGTVRDRIFRRR